MVGLKAIKLISIGLSIVGAAVSVASDIVGKKELDKKVADAVAKALNK